MSRRVVLIVLSFSALLLAVGCGDDTDAAEDTGRVTVTTASASESEDHGEDGSMETHDDGDAQDEQASATPPDADGMVIEVEMVEFGFEGGPFEVPAGEAVTFRFVNSGAVEHEAMFGDAHQQAEFAASTEEHGDHGSGDDAGGHHGDVQAITVGPGESAELIVTLQHGDELMGCHLPGHYDAGMVSPVTVV